MASIAFSQAGIASIIGLLYEERVQIAEQLYWIDLVLVQKLLGQSEMLQHIH